jgi:hypothetical protein
MKLTAVILGYVYWPLLYFGVYLPFIVPELTQWNRIPFWIVWPPIIGFIVVLISLGIRRSHKLILIHSFGIALFLQILTFALSRFQMPGFLKSYETGFLPDAIAPVLLFGIIAGVLSETGRYVVKLKERGSNQPDETPY